MDINLHIKTFIQKFEEIIEIIIQQSYPRHWQEDEITHSLLKSLEENFLFSGTRRV